MFAKRETFISKSVHNLFKLKPSSLYQEPAKSVLPKNRPSHSASLSSTFSSPDRSPGRFAFIQGRKTMQEQGGAGWFPVGYLQPVQGAWLAGLAGSRWVRQTKETTPAGLKLSFQHVFAGEIFDSSAWPGRVRPCGL